MTLRRDAYLGVTYLGVTLVTERLPLSGNRQHPAQEVLSGRSGRFDFDVLAGVFLLRLGLVIDASSFSFGQSNQCGHAI